MIAVMEERMTDYLDSIDRSEAADLDVLIADLQEAAARRGFTIKVGPNWIDIECVTSRDGSTTSMAEYGHITPEFLTDLTAYFENAEEPMNIYSTDLFKYLAGDMIGQKNISLTIASVTIERMNSGKGGEQAKPCLHFKERDKLMVLNKTNASLLAQALGAETDLWTGATVVIAAPMIEAFGRSTRSLKVVNVIPPDVPNKPRGNAQPAQGASEQDALFDAPAPQGAGAFTE